jgi:hypothetical protein
VRKAFTIILLLIFLFNVGGFYVIFWALRHQANIQLTARLDAEQYTQEETIVLKIPVSLPYPIHHEEFQRVNGSFEYKGDFYKLVKQKIQNDTLYAVCLKDVREKKLVNTFIDYVNLSNDLSGSAEKTLSFLGKLLKDFDSNSLTQIIRLAGWQTELLFIPSSNTLQTTVLPIQSPPPEA